MHKLIFKYKYTEAKNIVTFVFEPIDQFVWRAGQYIRVEITGESENHERWFSISSAPYEKIVAITTRMTGSKFKDMLFKLKPGELITVDKPKGDFIWLDDGLPKVLIAGGIGISAFRPMLKQQVHIGGPVIATLLYFTNKSEIVYKPELDELEKLNPKFDFKYLFDQKVNIELLTKVVPNLVNCQIYIAGPEPMVEQIGGDLVSKLGIAKSQLKQDWFPGYK